MPLTVYTGLCAPIMKYQGESNVAPAFAHRITVIAESSSQAMRMMAGYFKTMTYPVAIEGAGMEQPKFDGMEVYAFETGQVDGTEDGRNVVLR
jgi:hypothetical protein